jgi:hypothetical protein
MLGFVLSYFRVFVILCSILNSRAKPCATKGARNQWMRVPHGQLSVRSDSYRDGGWGDSTRRSSWDKGLPWVDRANPRAATCSESRAGSESKVVTSTRRLCGEDRSIVRKKPTRALAMVTGVVGAARREGSSAQRGRPERDAGWQPVTASLGRRSRRESERPIVPWKPGNAGGGKGPHFRVLLRETRTRRLAR